jgi:gamma-glutamyltranspeptidase / glutathione hydrolase
MVIHPYKRGMVCVAHPYAAEAGLAMLQQGGNAIDAAIAVSFALTVVEPHASGLGGGGFWTIWMPPANAPDAAPRAGHGRMCFLDFRECAPQAATPDRYYGTGKTLDELTLSGPLAVAVPGMPAGLAYAAAHYGKLSRDTLAPLLEPAIRYAQQGFEITPKMAVHLATYDELLTSFPTTARIFTRSGGPIPAGAHLHQPDLAKTFIHIQEAGLRTFVDGALAEQIEQYMAATGGLVTQADLAHYQPQERAVIQGSYRGYTLWTAPPPSTGGLRLLQVLNIMEQYPIQAWGAHAVETIHLLAEALKPSYDAGERHIADPATATAMPLEGLLDKNWAIARSRELSLVRVSPSTTLDAVPAQERSCTTHYSIIDQWGNIVSATQTLGLFWGSGMVIPNTGLLLNGEMNDFSSERANINAVAPGKIPRSNMCPTIVLKDNKPFLILGSPGSQRIPSAVLQTISNVIDHGMDLPSAVAAPRVHWQNGTLYLEGGIPPEVAEQLRHKGHTVKLYTDKNRYFGGVHAILIDPDTGALRGAADPRRDGQASGY